MSNIKTARKALEAELKHVEQGVKFYQERAETLRRALAQIDVADMDRKELAVPAKTASNTSQKGRKRSVDRQSKAGSGDLHRTPKEFWLQIISDQPQTAAQIAKHALSQFKPALSSDQVRKLKLRVGPMLQSLLNSKEIKSTGAGRQRTYVRAAGKSTAGSASKSRSKEGQAASITNGDAILH